MSCATAVGGDLPERFSDRRPAQVGSLAGGIELTFWAMGAGGNAGSGASPPPAPGSRFTLAFYTGQSNPDPAASCNPRPEPLCNNPPDRFCGRNNQAFFNAECAALELCRGRSTCIPVGLIPTLGIQPCFQNGKWCESFPGGPTVEDEVDQAIASYVATFNAGNPDGYRITKLAIVSHMMDVPYRAFLFPYKPCNVQSAPGVDNGSTDNTYPRDGVCQGGVIDPSGRFDGGTGSADFRFADLDGDSMADLDYARVSGQTLCEAMIHVATLRALLPIDDPGAPSQCGLIPCPPLDPPDPPASGAINISGPGWNEQISGLFDGAYDPPKPNPNWCLPPQDPNDPIGPYCPNNVTPCDVGQSPFDVDNNVIRPMSTVAAFGFNYEVGLFAGHQIDTYELPKGVHFCGCPGYPDCIWVWNTDRHRTLFRKGTTGLTCPGKPCQKEPDVDQPIFSSDRIQNRFASGPEIDLAPSLWLLGGSAQGYYNYINNNNHVRDCNAGPDSSYVNTLIPGGAAGYNAHQSVNSQIPQQLCYGTAPELFQRELALGRTLGEARRRSANTSAKKCIDKGQFYQADAITVGEPGFRLHVKSQAPPNLAILLAPGPGASPLNLPMVWGYDRDSRPLAATAFLAYGTFDFGCNVAGAQIDSAATDEILTGAGYKAGYAPHVRAFDWDGTSIPTTDFFAYGSVGYGVNVASFGYEDDAIEEILTAPGPGSVFGPQVRAFSYDGVAVSAIAKVSFFAFSTGGYGANVAGGDVLPGPREEILVGRPGNAPFGPRAALFEIGPSGFAQPVDEAFVPFLPASYGVNVAITDVDLDPNGLEDMMFGAGPGPSNLTSLIVLKGKRVDGSGGPLSSPWILASLANAFGANDYYGVRLSGAQLDDQVLDHELIVTRGWDPAAVPNWIAKGYKVIPQPPGGIVSIIPDIVLPNAGVAGLSVSGAEIGRDRVPMSALSPPEAIIDPIRDIVSVCEETVFRAPESQEILLCSCVDIGAMLVSRDFRTAREAIAAFRNSCTSEVVAPFVRTELLASVDALEARTVLAEEDLPPQAALEGPTAVCPYIEATYSALGSTDPDDRGPGRLEIQSYLFAVDGVPVGESTDGFMSLAIPPASHIVSVTVTDTFGLTGTAFLAVEAIDTEPPRGYLWLTPSSLWPPDHSMVEIQAALQVTDRCDASPTYRLLSVTSDEPEKGCGSGSFAPDVEGVEEGTPDTTFSVRAERCGTGEGRTYTATYEIRDASGNVASVTGTIVVPHDQGD